jgi:DNA-binding NtrC family response regulator
MPHSVLLIDDEDNLRSLMAKVLELEGYSIVQAKNLQTGWKYVDQDEVVLVITDVRLPDGNGVEFAGQMKERFPAKEVIVLTAYGNIPDGVRAIKAGAFDYLTKSDHHEKLIPLVSKAFEKASLQHRVRALEHQLQEEFGFSRVIGQSKVIREAVSLAQKVATTDHTVLLTGETGTGKEVFAHALHTESARKQKPFVAINCSAIAKDLLESELFGYAAGAFTHATKDKRGLLEEAHTGTLFLDEVGELNVELQAKLLRVLETGEYYRVGDSRLRKANVRIVAATNREL